MERRRFLETALGTLVAAGFLPSGVSSAVAAEQGGDNANGQPFDRARLEDMARKLAESSYDPVPEIPESQLPEMKRRTYKAIGYRPDRALWADRARAFRARFFHPGLYYRQPVSLYEVVDGTARPIPFDKADYSYPNDELKQQVGENIGHAGVHLFHHLNWQRDVVSFLGATYFRAVGQTMQYGISARGIAIDTTDIGSEEFPRFTDFWLERPGENQQHVRVHALMDGESVTGAYSFDIWPGATTEVNVDALIFPRRELSRVGIAPLTSMYAYGENDYVGRRIYRSEAHDSDGVQVHRGNGEWIWRPLTNPHDPRVSSFVDENPRGFGLCQRDRAFDHYQDPGANYEDRPNLWIEPGEAWGKGAVELVELPTSQETLDNIIAYWKPDSPLKPGEGHRFTYRQRWGSRPPVPGPSGARVVATRLGRGGKPGGRNSGTKFVIDFAGGDLPMLAPDRHPTAVVKTSRGETYNQHVFRIEKTGNWRVEFDMKADGDEDVDLRCFLSLDGAALSETWLYRWNPVRWDESRS
ncbi:glucan biosynthesis protein [Rhodovibrio salinarum]|uniref:glucan biosynthesis protein n=1 Tax=Rhodovibrio salinarum TaxID=1087 RepID=UPI00048208B1|nr:glucan biosynthesis protein [Rhodovibrio salinarum]